MPAVRSASTSTRWPVRPISPTEKTFAYDMRATIAGGRRRRERDHGELCAARVHVDTPRSAAWSRGGSARAKRCSTGPLRIDFTCRLRSSASTSMRTGFEGVQRVGGHLAGIVLRRGHVLHHVGVGVTEVRADDLGALLGQLQSQRVRQRPERGLRGTVRAEAADPREHRVDVDERAVAVGGEDRCELLRDPQRSEDVRLEDRPSVLDGTRSGAGRCRRHQRC